VCVFFFFQREARATEKLLDDAFSSLLFFSREGNSSQLAVCFVDHVKETVVDIENDKRSKQSEKTAAKKMEKDRGME
jgi:hypothetical protein